MNLQNIVIDLILKTFTQNPRFLLYIISYCLTEEMVADGRELAETRLLWDEFAKVVNLLKINLLFAALRDKDNAARERKPSLFSYAVFLVWK